MSVFLAVLAVLPGVFGSADGLPVQFSKVVYGGLELPLAAAQLKPAHAEATGILAVLHLPEHRFDAGSPFTVEGAAAFGAQLSIHARLRQ